jgi:hypothetical protein
VKGTNIPNSFIAVGGSQIETHFKGEDFSYINLLTKQTGYQCLAKLNNTGLKNPTAVLQRQIDKYNPEIVLLQPDDLLAKYSTKHTKLPLLQFLHSFIFSLSDRRSNKKYFSGIRTLIENNPNKQFIILSPVPCNDKYQDKVKLMRGREMNKIFSTSANATYINLLNSIKRKKRFFIEASYLNRFGHTLLARLIAQKSGLTLSASQRRFAA